MQNNAIAIRQEAAWARLYRSPEEPSLLHRHLASRLRSRRVFWLLLGAWIINLFDLGFTLLAHEQGILTEMNPVAVHLLLIGPLSVVVFKVGTMLFGSAIVWRFREMLFVERCVWMYALVCAGLSYWWYQFYLQADSTWMMACLSVRYLPGQMIVPPVMP